ncbi:Uncharacterised protein [Pannonibacter phragmitetus]|uniref:Uncharacterized protein n=1 Tax=Pannonibacter phragmitetus TaxID=121719 RepID=A0A378ZZI0_9HYPH|nr:hypothetical protein [Pannonibacter phragmitetus]SUB02289.1 Uncharacterised protein [Pannonibacter phragmitetus]
MEYYVGLDVSLKSTHICVMDQERQVVWRGSADTQRSMIAERLKRWQGDLAKLGFEAGQTAGSQACTHGGCSQIGSPAAWALEEGGSFPRRAWWQSFIEIEIVKFVRKQTLSVHEVKRPDRDGRMRDSWMRAKVKTPFDTLHRPLDVKRKAPDSGDGLGQTAHRREPWDAFNLRPEWTGKCEQKS